jgi:hypothetical protein
VRTSRICGATSTRHSAQRDKPRRADPPKLARAHARLGVAVTRGLLLDLLATRDVAAVDAAMEAFIEVYASWLERWAG